MTEAVQLRENRSLATRPSVADILEQKALIQDAMKSAMQDGQHFGKIPGCGDKPTLLQPGAQTILLLFRMNPDYDTEVIDLDRGHREYRVKCRLTNSSGEFIGSGLGSCSTMEGKYRYRVAPKTLTDREVPKAYWDLRKSDPKAAQELLGGPGFSTKKNEAGAWMIAEGSSDKVEHENPADYYNTCLKMAKKRALVDATLTRTAASDIFTQDVEEIRENLSVYEAPERPEAPKTPPATQNAPVGNPGAKEQPSGEPPWKATLIFSDYRVQTGKTKAGKPWKLFICSFEDIDGKGFQCSTFSESIGSNLDVLKGQDVRITWQPGRKEGTLELVSIEPDTAAGDFPPRSEPE